MSFTNNNMDNYSPVEDLFGGISFNDTNSSRSCSHPEVSSAVSSTRRYMLRSGKTAQAVPSEKPVARAAVITQPKRKGNPPPRHAKVSHSRNKLSGNRIGDYQWYDNLPTRRNWMAGQAVIRYTDQGELHPTLMFERETLLAYVHGCREQLIPLRLWVQNPPTTQKERYMTPSSHLCRYADCPVLSRTIMRGMLQVSMDEHPTETTDGQFDPFFTAGCFHLFCLEEMISLPELMQVADVQPDVRELPLEEKNPMSLNREERLITAYRDWKEARFDRYVRKGLAIPSDLRPNQRLVGYLMRKKVQNQPSTRQRKREERAGNDFTKHWGDLHKFVALDRETRALARQQRAAERPLKRRRSHDAHNGRSEKRMCFDEPSPSLRGWPSPEWTAPPPPFPETGMYEAYVDPPPFPETGAYEPIIDPPPYMANMQTFYPFDPLYAAIPLHQPLPPAFDFQPLEPYMGSEQLQQPPPPAFDFQPLEPSLDSEQLDFNSFFDAEVEKHELEQNADLLADVDDFLIDPVLLHLGMADAIPSKATPEAKPAYTGDIVFGLDDLLVGME